MKLHKHILSFTLIFILSLAAYAQNDKFFVHTVTKGQTLYSISKMYDTTVDEIIRMNPECANKLAIGYKLKIAQKGATAQGGGEPKRRYHTIQTGETLYRLSKIYGVTPQAICEANPGLGINNFRTGEVILIPETAAEAPVVQEQVEEEIIEETEREAEIRTTHKVEKGETLYSISRLYNITVEELLAANPQIKKRLKRKSIIAIPYSKRELAEKTAQEQKADEREQSNAELFRKIEEEADKNAAIDGALKVAVVLPFMLDTYSPTEQSRMVEYYEGFLMAVERLKEYGYSFEISTFDSGKGSESLEPLLTGGRLDGMNIIFGALHPKHNKELARYAQKMNIPLVIPFTSKEDEIFRNPMVYVVNTMQSYFFSEVADHFAKQFPKANVIFINSSNGENIKKEFVGTLKKSLDKMRLPHTTVDMELFTGTEPDFASIKAAMSDDRENIFIPTSGSESTLGSLLASMLVMKNDTVYEIPQFTLFGYPEWQIYAGNMQSRMYEVGTYFYTSFFSHASFDEVTRFQRNYTQWYSHTYQNIYPRYSMLGYDTGYFFLLAASRFGKEMPDHIHEVEFTPIQTGFKFERVNNWGGFVNKKIYFVHYSPEYKVEKIDFDR